MPKYDLACGTRKQEGFIGIDLNASVQPDVVFNLLKFPWPVEDSTADELYCAHFLEHIPCADTVIEGRAVDHMVAFMEECFRILKPLGVMRVVFPCVQSTTSFRDPTHRRFMPAEVMAYFSAADRATLGVSFYDIRCNFEILESTLVGTSDRPPSVESKYRWNEVHEIHMKLKALK